MQQPGCASLHATATLEKATNNRMQLRLYQINIHLRVPETTGLGRTTQVKIHGKAITHRALKHRCDRLSAVTRAFLFFLGGESNRKLYCLPFCHHNHTGGDELYQCCYVGTQSSTDSYCGAQENLALCNEIWLRFQFIRIFSRLNEMGVGKESKVERNCCLSWCEKRYGSFQQISHLCQLTTRMCCRKRKSKVLSLGI